MGLGGTLTSWQIQTLYFGHRHADTYSVLVMDNRGIGRSDKPLGRYTTSSMARDVVELMDHVGWAAPRQINLVGISMGGMVAQEVACLVPGRVQSLSLLCTSSRVESGADKSLVASAWDRLRLFRPFKSEGRDIEAMATSIFTPDFLAAPDTACDPLPSPATTPMCGPAPAENTTAPDGGDGEYPRFASNFQRFQALELHKRRAPGHFTRLGFFCQLMAAAGHCKTPAQLAAMADEVGRDRILVMHGTRDEMLVVRNGERLIRALEPAAAMVVDGLGHAPIFERAAWFNDLLHEKLGAWAKLDLT